MQRLYTTIHHLWKARVRRHLNHRNTSVLTVTNPTDYTEVITALQNDGIDSAMRRAYAVKAFRHTAQYDATVAGYLGADDKLPDSLTLTYNKMDEMRYGENPHQAAAFYREAGPLVAGTIANYRQLQGKALSYNNIADTDAALECVKVFDGPACVIV